MLILVGFLDCMLSLLMYELSFLNFDNMFCLFIKITHCTEAESLRNVSYLSLRKVDFEM